MSEKSVKDAVSFGERLAASQAFSDLFRDGMALVEQTAAYLDGPGRQEAKRLSRNAALAYATESMRLTTRLMQLASWLLLHRAVQSVAQGGASARCHDARNAQSRRSRQSGRAPDRPAQGGFRAGALAER